MVLIGWIYLGLREVGRFKRRRTGLPRFKRRRTGLPRFKRRIGWVYQGLREG